MKGDKYCVICRAWLGNYITGETPTGTASYYSLIKRKYCPTCKPWKRKKKRDTEREQQFAILKDENRELKQMLSMLREENERLKG
ncbi:MAG: hypothetical protein K6B38_15320 [Ruminococcus sp.]|nr:hypothetical protein [Ruminococcus sp.]